MNRDIALALCNAFGINPDGLISFSLHVSTDAPPIVTTTRYVGASPEEVTRQFRLVSLDDESAGE